jgi:hypothetical protein
MTSDVIFVYISFYMLCQFILLKNLPPNNSRIENDTDYNICLIYEAQVFSIYIVN